MRRRRLTKPSRSQGSVPASGIFLINPPYTLAKTLRPALEQLVQLLGQDRHAACLVEAGGH
ncbi:MAG: hypothetical protein RL509_206 [Pseudomonadota bacterium]